MTVAYHLRGYDLRTDAMGPDIDIPAAALPAVRQVAPDADPEFVDPRALTPAQAVRVAGVLECAIDASRFAYFLESDQPWAAVAQSRDALRANA